MVQVKYYCVVAVVAAMSVFSSAAVIADDFYDDEQLQQQFSIGMDALEHDRVKTAREAFSGILSSNPELHRARLELARAYYLSLDYDNARREAQTVLEDPNTPVFVRTTLLAFLAQIKEDEKRLNERHHWTPSIYLGFMHDTNVNVGPDRDVINIRGESFTVSGTEESDTAFVVNPGLTHTYNPGKTFNLGEHSGYFLWQSQLNGYYRSYFDETDFNLGVLTFRTGPAWVVPRHWRAGIGFQIDQIWLGDDRLAIFGTLNPNITWQFGENTEVTLDGVLARRYYNKQRDEDREGWYRSAEVSAAHYFNNGKLGIQGGAGYARFDADGGRFSYRGPNAFVGVIIQPWKNGSVYARASYRQYDYRGEENLFFEARDDDEYRYIVGFQHNIQGGLLAKWAVLGNWIYTDNQSNVAIFDYDRNQFNLGVSRSF
ncbi:MAG: DUF2860 family protein [Methylococcales bacterium]